MVIFHSKMLVYRRVYPSSVQLMTILFHKNTDQPAGFGATKKIRPKFMRKMMMNRDMGMGQYL